MAHKLHHLEIHPAKNGGHVVQHHFLPKASKSGAYMERPESEHHVFGPEQHSEMVAHVSKHLGLALNEIEKHEEAEGEE